MPFCQWKPEYCGLLTYSKIRRRSTNEIYCGASEIFIHLPFDSKSHLLCSIPTKFDQIWEMGLDWRQIWYYEMWMTTDQNSVMSQFEGGGIRDWNRKNGFFFSRSMGNPKWCNISKNQLPRSIRRGDMEFSPLFVLEKERFIPYLPYKLSS